MTGETKQGQEQPHPGKGISQYHLVKVWTIPSHQGTLSPPREVSSNSVTSTVRFPIESWEVNESICSSSLDVFKSRLVVFLEDMF